MLDREDQQSVARRFAADDQQISRDHLISHLLAALPNLIDDDTVFFGGTALSRTHLPIGRLSEDIDLYTLGYRQAVARTLVERWPTSVRREFPGLVWDPSLEDVRDIEPARLVTREGLTVRVQLVAADAGYQRWPTERVHIAMRYRDVGEAALMVPTRPAFVAMKAAAWRDRKAPRDLFDLVGLAEIGAIDSQAVELVRAVTGVPIVRADFVPHPLDWYGQLAHQCRLEIDAATALERTRSVWAHAAGWNAGQ